MRKLTMTLTAAMLLLGTMAMQAGAQNQQRAAATIHALKNATPIVRQHAAGERAIAAAAPVGSALALPVAAGAYPAGNGPLAHHPGMHRAASARRPSALT